jgi:hypothetical protein
MDPSVLHALIAYVVDHTDEFRLVDLNSASNVCKQWQYAFADQRIKRTYILPPTDHLDMTTLTIINDLIEGDRKVPIYKILNTMERKPRLLFGDPAKMSNEEMIAVVSVVAEAQSRSVQLHACKALLGIVSIIGFKHYFRFCKTMYYHKLLKTRFRNACTSMIGTIPNLKFHPKDASCIEGILKRAHNSVTYTRFFGTKA